VVEIKGLEKFSPRDFPGCISATVFLGSCNFRCPYCHNAGLVLHPERLPSFPLDFFLGFLDRRKDWLDGVCVTGGEPLLHPDLEDLLLLLKERSLRVKLDTNGSLPGRLGELIRQNLIDHVAMDVKAPLRKYARVTRSSVSPEAIRESIRIIMESGLDHTFRTTVVPGLWERGDLEEITGLLRGARLFQIQQFVPRDTLDPEFARKRPFPAEEIREIARRAAAFFAEVRTEGV